MKSRLALIAASAVAALVISFVATELMLWSLKPGRIEEISWWRIQTLTVLPATIAAAVASAWSSGRRYWPRLDVMTQSLCIILNSYLLYGVFTALRLSVEPVLLGGASVANAFEMIGWTIGVAALMTFAAMIVTGMPVFVIEYVIVRFTRRHSRPTLSSEVVP